MSKKIEYSRYDPRYNIMPDDFDTNTYTSTIYPMLLRRVCYFNDVDTKNCMDCHIDVYPDIDSTITWNKNLSDSDTKDIENIRDSKNYREIDDFDAEKVNNKVFYDNTRIPINNLRFEINSDDDYEHFGGDKEKTKLDNYMYYLILFFLILLLIFIIKYT